MVIIFSVELGIMKILLMRLLVGMGKDRAPHM